MPKIFYCPRLNKGQKVHLPWPIIIYRLANHICWPLENDVAYWTFAVERFLYIFGFMHFCFHIESDIRYLRLNFENLDEFLAGVPTILVTFEVFIRAFQIGHKKEKFKKFLQLFFREIYIEQSVHPEQYKKIHQQLLPFYIQSTFYVLTLASFTIVAPIFILSAGKRELLYKTVPPMEYKDNLCIYLPLLLMNIWIGFIIVTMVFGELNVLANCIFHLSGRYTLMRENFHKKVDDILKMDSNLKSVNKYRQLLVQILEENLRLNEFAEYIQTEFTFRIFIGVAFSAIILCALVFKVYTSPMTSITFMFWTVAKILEIIALGYMGTTIRITTDEVSSMYYNAQWESIIECSLDSNENVQLMKLINLSIMTNKKPFNLKGLNFFNVSISSAISILQGAFSYFTCLIALRN